MIDVVLVLATGMQALAVVYGLVLLGRHQGAAGAWLFLLGAMLSMLAWRVVILMPVQPPAFFNYVIAIWGSTCMLSAMFLFGREVARRERAEAERDALLTSERAAREEAERANQLKDEFLATLSHELRTPLAAILSWCALLRMRSDDGSTHTRAVQTIERNANAQVRLVDDLLDVTRMQAGKLHLDLVPVRLDAPVRAALQAVQPMAASKGVTLDFSTDDVAPLVNGDAGRLQQVASNLIVNAVKFTPAGGTVTIAVTTTDAHARLVVTDTGEGIAPDFLPHIFTRFRQADSSERRRQGGLGLGLAIVATLVHLHGGEVRAASAGLGTGASFTVTLPLAAVETRSTVQATADAGMGTAPDVLKAVRVLIVDDAADVRGAVSELLTHAGAEVLALESGLLIEPTLAEFRPHVLLLDIGIPGEDGYAVLRRIRALPPGAGGRVPAICFTAHARDQDRAHAIASGFQRHLAKPIDVGLLIATVSELVDGSVADRSRGPAAPPQVGAGSAT